MRRIVCIGDSLTAGFGGGGVNYPAVLRRCFEEARDRRGPETGEQAEIPEIVNLGVNGEDTVTILGRTGAVPFELSEPFAVPAPGESAEIHLESPLAGEHSLLVYGDAGMEKVWLPLPEEAGAAEQGDAAEGSAAPREICGSLTLAGGYYYGDRYVFRRDRQPGRGSAAAGLAGRPDRSAGERTVLPEGTKLQTRAAREYREGVPVILMGANGTFRDPEELILQHRTLISFYRVPAEQALILGLHFGSRAQMAEMEKKMAEAFGRRYVNVREYMSTRALSDAGLVSCERDRLEMEEGRTPSSLLSDGLHFNRIGYELLGKLVYAHLTGTSDGV